MKKFFLFLLISFLAINTSFASIEDDSIEKELNKNEVKELQIDFKLKKFKSCDDMSKVMEKYIKTYWENNKQRYIHPMIMYKKGVMLDSVSTESNTAVESKSITRAS
jgi:hypothetical protein